MPPRSRSGSRPSRSRGGGRPRTDRRDEARWSAARVAVRTPFALAEVVPEPDRPWRRLLRLDGEDCSHVDLRDPTRIDFAYVRRFADVADLLSPRGRPLDALHLGGGGFTLPRYLAATRPGSRSEVAEIDGELVGLARAELGLRTDRATLRVRVDDARAVLARRATASADLVVLDAFHGTTVPSHLTTLEFIGEVRRALRPGGAFAANVIDVPPLPVARALLAAARELFEHTAIVATRKVVRGRQGGNVVVLASQRPTALPLGALAKRALAAPVPELLVAGDALRDWLGGVKPLRDPVDQAASAAAGAAPPSPPDDGAPAAPTADPPLPPDDGAPAAPTTAQPPPDEAV